MRGCRRHILAPKAPKNSQLALAVNRLDAGYGAVKALRGVTLNVEAGETIALLGTNGNGKSTLMKCIMGLVRPWRGEARLTVDGNTHDLTTLSAEAIVDLGVAMVPEGRRLFPKLTVIENLMLGAFRKAARRDIDRNLAHAFETFPVLKQRSKQLAGTMSGGQQQMLAIARALMSSPRLLLIDEPSVGLSPLLVSQMIAKIGELSKNFGLTVLMAEQNFNQAIRIADRGYIIVHGEIVVTAGVEELKGNDIVKRLYLGGAV
jgi:branched-chain amino acid transport system ATP-binding protein